jgi:hypothetical protein
MLSGGAVSWSTKRQPTVSMSSTEAEYIGQFNAAREATWIRLFLEELGFGDLVQGESLPIASSIDSAATIQPVHPRIACETYKCGVGPEGISGGGPQSLGLSQRSTQRRISMWPGPRR